MSNVLIGIIGVILFIGLALAGALFLGDRFTNTKTQSEAARYVSEGSQISKAYEMFRINEGAYPSGTDAGGTAYDADATKAKLIQLNKTGYLKSIPQGSAASGGSWYVDSDKGAAFSYLGTDTLSQNICIEARKQNGLTGTPLACTDATLTNNDPCCTG